MNKKIRIAILWTQLTTYAHSVFSKLSSHKDVDLWCGSLGKPLLKIQKLTDGREVQVFERPHTKSSCDLIFKEINDHRPDIYFGCGWNPKTPRIIAGRLKGLGIPTICCADTPWLGTLQQTLRCLIGGSIIRKAYDAIMIPGSRGLPFARLAGFPDSRIWYNLYSGNNELFSEGTKKRLELATQNQIWPKRFIFVGRLVDCKNISGLVAAYRRYRELDKNPWPMTIIGDGPALSHINACEGIDAIGWLKSNEIAQNMRESGVFVLPSFYEPWGVVVHEAACVGLPLLLSMDVGAGSDLLRDGYNGRLVDAKRTDAIADRMLWFATHPEPWKMGERSYMLSKQFSLDLWVENLMLRSRALLKHHGNESLYPLAS